MNSVISNNVLNDFQFSFRENYFTTSVLSEFVKEVLSYIDKVNTVCAVFLKLSKEFYSVK